MNRLTRVLMITGACSQLIGSPARPGSEEVVLALAQEAKKSAEGISGFSEARGEKLFRSERNHSSGQRVSCMTCHTANPKNPGKTRANKEIQPLAPIANSERFTDLAKTEKWFRRNCQDVLERPCTALEKGDFVTYMRSIK